MKSLYLSNSDKRALVYYFTIEKAAAAYKEAAEKYYGEFSIK